jgi:cytochrome P450
MISDFSTLFVAGSDTTSRTMMMLLYIVSIHPEVAQKLKGEIDTYIGCDEDITYETFKKMKYVDAVLEELTRYFQPADGILIR